MPDFELTQTTLNVWTLQMGNFHFWVWVTMAMLAIVGFGGDKLGKGFRRFLASFYGLLSAILMLANYVSLTGIVYFRERVVGLRAAQDIPQVNPVAEGVLAVALMWLLFAVGTIGTVYYTINAGKKGDTDSDDLTNG